jgi:hypothetical protein
MKKIQWFVLCFLIIVLLFPGCSKEEEEETTETAVMGEEVEVAVVAPYYFEATINNIAIRFEHDGANYVSTTSYSSSTSGDLIYVEQSFLITDGGQVNIGGASLIKSFPRYGETCNGFKAMFSEGNFSYGNMDKDSEGARVYYFDANGKYWSTTFSLGTQQGSSFAITSHQEVSKTYSEAITIAKFNCTLYDDQGNTMQLTDGEIKSVSVQCL